MGPSTRIAHFELLVATQLVTRQVTGQSISSSGSPSACAWAAAMGKAATGRKRKAAAVSGGGGGKKQKPSKQAGGKDKGGKKQGGKGKDGKKPGGKKPAADDADEGEPADEDVEFFEGNAAFSSFLMRMDAKALEKPVFGTDKKPVARPEADKKATDGKEQPPREEDVPLAKLEARPRKAAWEKTKTAQLANKLPVKFMDGSVRPNKLLTEADAKPQADEQEGDDEQEDADDEDADEDEDDVGSQVSELEFEEIQDGEEQAEAPAVQPIAPIKPAKALTPVDLAKQRERRLAAKKVEIAQLCESILESPEEAFKRSKEHPDQLSKIQQLQALSARDPDVTVQKLSLLSQLSVFLDILPDYRIRVPTGQSSDENKGNNRGRPQKKKVQQLQDYEASLLSNYQIFLKHCASVVTAGTKGKRVEMLHDLSTSERRALSLAETAVRCLSELLQRKYAFNFHLNLIMALVPLADSPLPAIHKPACEAFSAVFRADKACTSSLAIVQQVSAYVKQKEHRVRPFVLRALIMLPLEVTMEQGESARKRAKADRKKRRRQQASGDAIAAGLKEAEAVVDRAERDKTQSDILHELVLIYFRVLKSPSAGSSPALPAVLEGLGKFAFLINLDILIDLLKVLKAMLKANTDTNSLPLAAALQAVLTGVRTLQSPAGQELLVDEKEFVDVLYRLLRQLAVAPISATDNSSDLASPSIDDVLGTAVDCVEAVLLRRKELVVDRVAAFVRRLLLVAMARGGTCPGEALALLALLRSLLHRYAKLQQLVDSEVDRVASGEFRADVDDPDFANAFASAAWELSLLSRHWHPAVSEFARGTAAMAPLLPSDRPAAMLTRYGGSFSSKGFSFVPKVSPPPRNPLFRKLEDGGKKRKDDKKRRSRDRARGKPVFVHDPYTAGLRRPSGFWSACAAVDTIGEGDSAELQWKR